MFEETKDKTETKKKKTSSRPCTTFPFPSSSLPPNFRVCFDCVRLCLCMFVCVCLCLCAPVYQGLLIAPFHTSEVACGHFLSLLSLLSCLCVSVLRALRSASLEVNQVSHKHGEPLLRNALNLWLGCSWPGRRGAVFCPGQFGKRLPSSLMNLPQVRPAWGPLRV